MDDLNEVQVKSGPEKSPLGILGDPPARFRITVCRRIQGYAHEQCSINIEDLQGGLDGIVGQIEPEDAAFGRDRIRPVVYGVPQRDKASYLTFYKVGLVCFINLSIAIQIQFELKLFGIRMQSYST